jgi:hypothetical protein
MSEQGRIRFIEQRDGKASAMEFCKRTLTIYRTCLLHSRKRGFDKPHHASFPEYRRRFIESICAFRSYISKSPARQ